MGMQFGMCCVNNDPLDRQVTALKKFTQVSHTFMCNFRDRSGYSEITDESGQNLHLI